MKKSTDSKTIQHAQKTLKQLTIKHKDWPELKTLKEQIKAKNIDEINKIMNQIDHLVNKQAQKRLKTMQDILKGPINQKKMGRYK